MLGRQAGSPIAVQYMREYNAESPKQGREGLNSIVKTTFPIFLLFIYAVQCTVYTTYEYIQNIINLNLHYTTELSSTYCK